MKELINNEMNFPVPDGFKVLNKEELNNFNTVGQGPVWGIQNDEKHMIIVVGYKNVGILSKMFSSKDAATSIEKSLAKPMAPYNYQLKEFSEFKVGDLLGNGINYTYVVQDIEMQGTSLAVKKDNKLYYIHAYYRLENNEDSLKLLKDTINDITWN